MKLVTVVGNRPQLVKAAPLSAAFGEAGIDEVVVHTGQHWDAELSQVFIDELGLPEPGYRLDLRTADVPTLTPAIRAVLEDERPDMVVVLGDTNSTLAGARAAAAGGLPHRARRGRAAEPGSLDARGARPDRGRRARGPPALSGRALGGDAASRKGHRARSKSSAT